MPIDYAVRSIRTVPISGITEDAVYARSTGYIEMEPSWILVDDLLGGTFRMRQAQTRWLPQKAKESAKSYKVRLDQSYLYGALKDTIEKLVAKPFSRPVTVRGEESVSEDLASFIKDTDGKGADFTQLSRELFYCIVTYGIGHIFIDYTDMPEDATLETQREMDARPLARVIKPRDLIGWQVDDIGRFTQVRIAEQKTVPNGKYGDRKVHQIRVYNADGTWELWRQEQQGQWTLVRAATHTFPGIPLVTAYADKVEDMFANPPMMDLAELNLRHWQSSSEQNHNLSFGRIGMIGMTGISQEEIEKPLVLAPNAALRSVNPDAKFGYVEPTGKALDAGEKDLRHIEEQMEVLGLQPLVSRTAKATATAEVLDEGKSEASIMLWIRALEKTLERVLVITETWITGSTDLIELPKNVAVDVFSEFATLTADPKMLDWLLKLRMAGEITRETFLQEAKRRGIFGDAFDIAVEAGALDQAEEAERKLTEEQLESADPFGDADGEGHRLPFTSNG